MKTTLSLSGIVGKNVEISQGPKMLSGRFPVAIRKQIYENNEWKFVTSWHQVVIFGDWTKFIKEIICKGKMVTVKGYEREREYNGKIYHEIVATNITL